MAGFWDKRVKAIAYFKHADTFSEDWEKKFLSFQYTTDRAIRVDLKAFDALRTLLGTDDIEFEFEGGVTFGEPTTTLSVKASGVKFPDFDKKG